MKRVSKMVEFGKVNVGNKDHWSELEMTRDGDTLLTFEVLEGRVRSKSLWKVVQYMEEVRNKRVELCIQLACWKFLTWTGLLEERVHPGDAGDS